MRKVIRKWMDPRYTKIAIYSIVSAGIIFGLCLIIYNSNDALKSGWALMTAVMKPLVLGLIIAYLLLPLVKILENKLFGKLSGKRMRRNLAVVLIYLIIALAIIAGFAVLIVSVTRSVSYVSFSGLQEYADHLQKEFAKFWGLIESSLANLHISLGTIGESAAAIFINVKSAGSTFLFAMIFSIYFLLDSGIKTYWGKVAHILFKDKTIDKAREFLNDADRVFSGYIRGQALDALIMGTMVTITFLIAEVPYAAVIGILTGIGNLIPFVGPIVGFASLIIACIAQGAFSKLIIGGIILIIVLFIDGNIINPKLLSNTVKIHPVLVFLALIAGGEIGGLVGMLVAVPCVALLKQVFEKDIKRRERNKAQAGQETQAEQVVSGVKEEPAVLGVLGVKEEPAVQEVSGVKEEPAAQEVPALCDGTEEVAAVEVVAESARPEEGPKDETESVN